MTPGSAACSQNTRGTLSIQCSTAASPAGHNVLSPPLCSGTSPSPPPPPAGRSGTSAARAVRHTGTHFHPEDLAQPPFWRAQEEQITGWDAGGGECMREQQRGTEIGREQWLRLAGWMDGWTHLWEGVFVRVFLYAQAHKINGKYAGCLSFLLVLPIKKKSE